VPATIAVCAVVAFVLRAYQVTRPGYLLGVTEYDDGVMFGDALQFVSGAIPYRDFAVVQPPGSMLVVAPVALLAKVTGTAWGLAVARILTVCVDTVNVILLGVLVRHRGALTAGIACGLYAVYPDALTAAHTFMLEPWINLCCLAGAVLVFDGDRLAATAGRRLAWGGALLGFGVTVKIWALLPLALIGLLLAVTVRRPRPVATLAGGAALGIGLPVLPFLVLAPGALARDVVVSQLVRNASGSTISLTSRLADMAGLQLLSPRFSQTLVLVIIGIVVAALCAGAYLGRARRPAALDAYALLGAVTVTAMLLWPRLYYSHYGAFDGPFLALAIALPAGRLAARPAAGPAGRRAPGNAGAAAALQGVAAALAAILLVAMGISQLRTESREQGVRVSAEADRLIPAGACVVTDDSAYAVAADRFSSGAPGCPPMVDAFGTLFAMTGGHQRDATAAMVRPVDAVWQTTLARADYVWFTGDTVGQIPWNSQLYGYLTGHFRLIGFAGQPTHWRDVPRPGLYVRT
jgi:alpha-1,2-mannosyltransferase